MILYSISVTKMTFAVVHVLCPHPYSFCETIVQRRKEFVNFHEWCFSNVQKIIELCWIQRAMMKTDYNLKQLWNRIGVFNPGSLGFCTLGLKLSNLIFWWSLNLGW